MKQKRTGPYKHYQRPVEPRTVIHRTVSRTWFILLTLITVVLVALVFVVHQLASSGRVNNQAGEFRSSRQSSQPKKTQRTKTHSQPKHKVQPEPESKAKKPNKAKVKQATSEPKEYLVKSGDSLTSIASRFNVTVDDLAQLNQLGPDRQIRAGQTLKVR
ncbi:LysM peptidoglycan-binding domain-containing protein [Lactobacillus xylocopicola]|uniref:N-acetylmuramidase n=1 Tax=Lactobacillus xylocopicola TaxID=2976676 RepID=A0ABM8BGQ7_9LACO|nr:LysM peptidoglycan-binding domain-containing protein [Lactobacillus xylocopicola]BDR60464.1 N-acetylmuramidase [Lactobacillus xylocopicola]